MLFGRAWVQADKCFQSNRMIPRAESTTTDLILSVVLFSHYLFLMEPVYTTAEIRVHEILTWIFKKKKFWIKSQSDIFIQPLVITIPFRICFLKGYVVLAFNKKGNIVRFSNAYINWMIRISKDKCGFYVQLFLRVKVLLKGFIHGLCAWAADLCCPVLFTDFGSVEPEQLWIINLS